MTEIFRSSGVTLQYEPDLTSDVKLTLTLQPHNFEVHSEHVFLTFPGEALYQFCRTREKVSRHTPIDFAFGDTQVYLDFDDDEALLKEFHTLFLEEANDFDVFDTEVRIDRSCLVFTFNPASSGAGKRYQVVAFITHLLHKLGVDYHYVTA